MAIKEPLPVKSAPPTGKLNTKAIAAYRRNGFTVAESVITDFGDGYVMDDYLMIKNLTP